MNILIAGGTGFIGKHLSYYLLEQGHDITILTRDIDYAKSVFTDIPKIHMIDWQHSNPLKHDIVINLCGYDIGSCRWSVAVKRKHYESRIGATGQLINLIKQCCTKEPLLLNASAIGFYSFSDKTQHEERLASGQYTYTKELVEAWEKAGRVYSKTVFLRFGVVLGSDGGMLDKLKTSFKYGVGQYLGKGDQWLSWIHIEDLISSIDFIINLKTHEEAYNLTAPKACRQKQFADELAACFNKKVRIRLPKWVIKLLFGQMGEELLLANQNIKPKRLQDSGFEFKFGGIRKALQNLTG